jgi:hypothetical protein
MWNLGVLTTAHLFHHDNCNAENQRMLEIPGGPTTGAKQKAQNCQLELPNNQLQLLSSQSELLTS